MSVELHSTSVLLHHIPARKAGKMLREPLIKAICLLLCIILPAIVGAQSQTKVTPSFTTTGAFFALSVADLEASTRWYSEKLGLKVMMQAPKQNNSAVAVLEGGGLIVELIQNDDARPLNTVAPAIRNNMLVHGIFKAGAVVDNLDKILAMFKERGSEIAMGPFPSHQIKGLTSSSGTIAET